MTAKDGQVFQAAGSVITGDVTIGRDCGVWYNAVIRGDEVDIHIGDRTNIQDNAVVHGDPGNPVHIGSGVTIGHGAIVHGWPGSAGTVSSGPAPWSPRVRKSRTDPSLSAIPPGSGDR